MKKKLVRIFIVSAILLFCTTTHAMTGLEFMQCSVSERAAVLKQIILIYVSNGYVKIPNWAALDTEIDEQIRRWGSGNKNIEDIAFEAAKARGMTQWK